MNFDDYDDGCEEIPYILTDTSMTVILNGVPRTVQATQENYETILDMILNQDEDPICIDDLMPLLEPIRKAVQISEDLDGIDGFIMEVDTDLMTVQVTVRGFEYPLSARLIKQISVIAGRNGNLAPLTEFVKNLVANPDNTIAADLFDFLQNCNLAITEDGCFLAYKKVNNDFMDCHTGKFDNSPGNTVSMPRFAVVRDRNKTCESGLHVAAWQYLNSYGGAKTVVCKVNPKNVISVPIDYSNQKMRVCEYTVLDEVSSDSVTTGVHRAWEKLGSATRQFINNRSLR